ncbi:hypothetical protein [Arthrobacter roseus]|uniref:hypothetical protein n=1 Tax=Arthrobacter roseus TaxID=136274 RepID=UPI001EF7D305|nr:hypothetical protein [Arthrobacter roseus]MBM7848750.1 hypothetical protein [Arthrobacter roseus]
MRIIDQVVPAARALNRLLHLHRFGITSGLHFPLVAIDAIDPDSPLQGKSSSFGESEK